MSADPALGEYLDTEEGEGRSSVYEALNLAIYTYSYNSPVKYNDPDGEVPIDTIIDVGLLLLDTGIATYNSIAKGDHSGWIDVGIDVLCIAIPYGSAAIYKAGKNGIKYSAKAVDKINDTTKVIDKVNDAGKVVSKTEDLHRPYIRKNVRKEVESRALKTKDGKFIDPNTRKPIEGKYDLGHKKGHEFRKEKAQAKKECLNQKQFNERMNNPDLYQIEDPKSNRSHKYEEK